MPEAFLFQDWVTVQGAGSGDEVVQSAEKYLDPGGYADVVFYPDVSDYSGTALRVYYHTAPTKSAGQN